MKNDKAEAITYNFNNFKLKKIVTMQNQKKEMIEVVNEIKLKIKLWKRKNYDEVAQD